MPKKVELLQDKVEKFPRPSEKFTELQREVADLAARRTREVAEIVRAEGSSPGVIRPAGEAASLSGALSTSLGPPLSPFGEGPTEEVESLAGSLKHQTAKFIEKIGDFAERNDENQGKKIEGTGLLQVSYFAWVGGFLALAFIGFVVLRVVLAALAASNPGVSVGMKVAAVGGRLVSRGFSEVLAGGERFKSELVKRATWTADEVKELFREQQERAQSTDVKTMVRDLTRKD